MNKKPKILVVGSFVMDLIVSANRFPDAGETVIGCGFSIAPGGKGANQAIQAARLGAEVVMLGKVGSDDFGTRLITSAKDSGVDTKWIRISENSTSAIGNVQLQVTEKGIENRIIVVPGANMEITMEDIEVLRNEISKFDMVVLQNEIPMEINLEVAKIAKSADIPVMLNPAPSVELSKELLECITFISPNEHEAQDIVGMAIKDEDGINEAVTKLHELGVNNVLITLGKNGSIYSNSSTIIRSRSIDCGKVVDPTAAGDSYIGAFFTAMAAGIEADQAMIFASCTAGITVSRMGAQTSLPILDEVFKVMRKNNIETKYYKVLK